MIEYIQFTILVQMKIYYSVSVRGGLISKAIVGKQINILKQYGFVQTEHLASDNPQIVDMNMSDNQIYQLDMDLLKESDVVIADCTAASLGVGYIISKAESLGKPVLCVHLCTPNNEKISAMIEGCPNITKEIYRDIEQFELVVRKFLISKSKANRIFLLGPPGSGKSTVAQKLSQEFQMENISTGQILRDIVSTSSDSVSIVIRDLMSTGQLIPAEIMKNIVFKRLSNSDCINNGFVLDGYPPSREDLSNLLDCNIIPTFVFYFECADATAIKRQCGRAERVTDVEEKALDRIKNFHEKIPDYETICTQWFKNIPVIKIDAENNPDTVYDTIKNIVSLFIYDQQKTQLKSSYFPIKPYKNSKTNSTRFHFHIDTPNHTDLLCVLKNVYAYCPELIGQIKLYPIEKLCLGKQITECDSYNLMINFHCIAPEDNEAFVTGKLGDNLDANIMKKVLLAVSNRENTDAKIMVELEEYTSEWMRLKHGKTSEFEAINIYGPQTISMDKLSDFDKYRIKHSPIELHLAFDLPKSKYPEQPIDLNWLNKQCVRAGFSNGGWFIFRNESFWAYRSNEFIDSVLKTAENKIKKQAKQLSCIIYEKFPSEFIKINYSIELVHGIWVF